MKVLNILSCGGVGGVENLCKDYSIYSKHDNYFVILWYPGKVSDEMIKMGTPVVVFDTKPSNYIKDLSKLIGYIKAEGFEAIIVHQVAALTAIYMYAIKIICSNVKFLTYAHSNAHDWSTNGFRGKIDFMLKRNIYRNSRKTVCISENVKKSVIDVFGVNEKNVEVIYNGVDIKRFKIISSEECRQLNDARLEIIYVGRLEKIKGVQNILLALSKTNVSYFFRIVGDGSYRNELELLSGRLGISEKVEFMGTRMDVPSLLCQSGVFIHTPDWQEGFGITVIEAMAAGCICIVNNHGALPEIVEDVVNGYVVEGIDTDRVAAILTDIWNRRVELSTPGSDLYKMKEAARKRAGDFNIENFAYELDKAVEML